MKKKTIVFVVANNKGGVGKSLICQLIASYLAYAKNLKVLALDFDPQGNMSYRFLKDDRTRTEGNYLPPIHPQYNPEDPEHYEWRGSSSSLDMWTDDPVVPYPTELDNLDVLPSNAQLISSVEKFEFCDSLEEIVARPYDFFQLDDFKDCGYDVIVIDTPPAKGPLTQAAIRAATHVLIPLELTPKSLQGLAGMTSLINRQNAAKHNGYKTKIIGLLQNKVDYNKRSPQTKIIEKIEQTPDLSRLLLRDIVLHDSARAVDIDEEQAPITAPYTELKETDRFAQESIALGEYVYKSLGFTDVVAIEDVKSKAMLEGAN